LLLELLSLQILLLGKNLRELDLLRLSLSGVEVEGAVVVLKVLVLSLVVEAGARVGHYLEL
jgi:hypothetical protein